ncbi:PDT-domain-containing protein [Daldinia caldariorum]|uniref:PDT-domain-containing protein n=1 Tax=Daldinia caldariorum TaxID=326644 RepID=UPI002007BC0B|nr:PDT-domain-containing protein [Daldinia caldariorum]KAI1467096.1 PDT-domain-containing protein [Daldinia caldariorum]
MESTAGKQQDNGPGAKPTVCFLGPVSSYTHQATLNTFPEDKFNFLPVDTIKDIFETTQSGRATCGVVPFENSSNGSVVFTLDQLADRGGEYPDLSVCAEIYLDVHHCLVGRRRGRGGNKQGEEDGDGDGEGDGSELAHVERVYSHPQAFGQCTGFLRARLRGVETVDVSSTSRAAALAADDPTGSSAAVSSAVAAQRLGLDVLARNIEDREDNTTRFFVLRRGNGSSNDNSNDNSTSGSGSGSGEVVALHPPIPELEEVINARRPDGAGDAAGTDRDVYSRTKSLASFTVPHRSPGALASVLECFRRARLNLTSINSRPSLAAPFRYVFFVEFEGHRLRDPERRVADALACVAAVAQSCRWWGSWDSMR